MKTISIPASAAAALILFAGCTPTIRTENEFTVKPIQVTIDVNLKVDQELNQALAAETPNLKADPDSDNPRERRRARRDQIKAWKSAQLIGESNQGLLDVRTPNGKVSDSVKKVIDAENADRQLVFETIARKQNIPAEAVAQRWASRMIERAEAGTLVQDAKGEWSEKQAK